MTPIRRAAQLLAATVSLAAIASAGPVAAQQRVGVNSAVNPAAMGMPPGGTARQLMIGQDVVYNERITTAADGQTQILFVDESAITVGPNSDLTIDEFVYDPATGTGTQALSATRGVFRYVGGKLSKANTQVTIRTPSATIGIRGGVFLMNLDLLGQLDVIFLYGKGLTVTGLTGAIERITRPGFATSVAGIGAAPSSPAPAPAGALAKFLAGLDGRSGGTGGARNTPSDSTVSGSGISSTVSGNLAASVQSAQQNLPQGNQPQLGNSNSPPVNLNLNTATIPVNLPVTQLDQQNPVPDISGLSGGFNSTDQATALGFPGQITPFANGKVENGVFIASIGNSPVSIPLVQGVGTIASDGTNSPLGPVTGTSFVTPDNAFFYANLVPVNTPDRVELLYGGRPVDQSAYAATGSPRFYSFAIQPDAALKSPIPFTRLENGGAIPNPSVSPLFLAVSPTTPLTADGTSFEQLGYAKALQASLAINGQGGDQSSALVVAVGNVFGTTGRPDQTNPQPVLNGIAEGSFRPNGTSPSVRLDTPFLTAIDSTGTSFYGRDRISGFVLNPNNCCNEDGSQIPGVATQINTLTNQAVTYKFNHPAVATGNPGIATGPQNTQVLFGFNGGVITAIQNGSETPYPINGLTIVGIDAQNLQASAFMVGVDSLGPGNNSAAGVLGLSFGSLDPGNTNARQGYIHDRLFGLLESPGGSGSFLNDTDGQAKLYMVTASAVPNTTLLPQGVNYCDCQYLQWGYWGGELTTPIAGGGVRRDIGHINTWVAGLPTLASDMNNLITMGATANYRGAAIGSVFSNGANYMAAGGLDQFYHFGTQTGTITISNFDGRTFGGTVNGANGTALFGGNLSGSGVTGAAVGSFYGPKAAETGGTFGVTGGPGYIASGIFAGKKVP